MLLTRYEQLNSIFESVEYYAISRLKCIGLVLTLPVFKQKMVSKPLSLGRGVRGDLEKS